MLAVLAGCSGSAAEEDEDEDVGALVDNSAAARATEADLTLLINEQRGRVVELTRIGNTHVCTVTSGADEVYHDVDYDQDDQTKVLLYRDGVFALYDGATGGAAALGSSADLDANIDAMLDDVQGSEGSIQTKGLLPTSKFLSVAAGRAFSLLRDRARAQVTKSMNVALKELENPSTQTAEAIEAATKKFGKWSSVSGHVEQVGQVLDIPKTDWKAFVDTLSRQGTKAVYFGDEGAAEYLASVADDWTVMFMTHSGKLSDARLAANPALRAYFDRGAEFMPRVMELLGKLDQRSLRVIGGGTLEGGQVPVYAAVGALQAKGVAVVADAVMAGPSAGYKIAAVENALVQGLDWGGESLSATQAAKVGFLWGGGGQAKTETLRLLESGKDVWVVRETRALAGIEGMPNAAAEIEAAAASVSAEARARLHVYETWEELEAALTTRVAR
jgi:hypothetical protein